MASPFNSISSNCLIRQNSRLSLLKQLEQQRICVSNCTTYLIQTIANIHSDSGSLTDLLQFCSAYALNQIGKLCCVYRIAGISRGVKLSWIWKILWVRGKKFVVTCTRALMGVARCIYGNCFVGKYFVVCFSIGTRTFCGIFFKQNRRLCLRSIMPA